MSTRVAESGSARDHGTLTGIFEEVDKLTRDRFTLCEGAAKLGAENGL